MARIVVLGAGIVGLAAGMMLARDGHEVTALERDPAPVPDGPDEAWQDWQRPGVVQFRLPHVLMPAGRVVLEAELPQVAAGLLAAGSLRLDLLSAMPPTVVDRSGRVGDDRFLMVTARRPVLEQVVGAAADGQPGLDVRRGVVVAGLVTRRDDGVVRVTGVRTEGGETYPADLVVDAMGRRSHLPAWLAEAGSAPMQEEIEPARFSYYGRFYRARTGGVPPLRAPLHTPLGSISLLTLPADNDTWAVIAIASAGDGPAKRLRDPDRFAAVVAASARHAHWLDGEPITPMDMMGGLADSRRRIVVDGRPAAIGIALLGDAWAFTNPSLGRGISLGLLQARLLRDTVRTHGQDPSAFALAWDAATEEHLTPWYEDTVQTDRARFEEMTALRTGSAPTTRPDPAMAAFVAAMLHDPELFRIYLDRVACLGRLAEAVARPDVTERIARVVERLGAVPTSAGATAVGPIGAGPDRERLLQLLA